MLIAQLDKIIATANIIKVLCFGLGDMFYQLLEWFTRETARELQINTHNSTVQHAMPLNMASMCRDSKDSNPSCWLNTLAIRNKLKIYSGLIDSPSPDVSASAALPKLMTILSYSLPKLGRP
jgi:hypothetical protein